MAALKGKDVRHIVHLEHPSGHRDLLDIDVHVDHLAAELSDQSLKLGSQVLARRVPGGAELYDDRPRVADDEAPLLHVGQVPDVVVHKKLK